MKTKALRISCRSNPEAVALANHSENVFDVLVDCREGKSLFIAIDEVVLKECDDTIDDIKNQWMGIIEDCCMVYEFDYIPDIEEIEYDFDMDNNEEGLDQI